MKKIMRAVQTMAALLLAAAATTACSGDDSIDDETRPAEPKTYTMTVQATKDDAMTRALAVDGTGALNATWKEGDKVAVLSPSALSGREQADAVVQAGQCAALAGAAVKGDGAGAGACLVRHRARAGEQLPVPQMDAVKKAEGNDSIHTSKKLLMVVRRSAWTSPSKRNSPLRL